jgi:hypothetical protein
MRRRITDGVDADAALSSSNEHPLTAKNWRNKNNKMKVATWLTVALHH